jgi:tetratricopeptide (TPR) repeat protein
MKPRRLSDAPLPRSPLDFAYRLVVRPPGSEGTDILAETPESLALHTLKALRLVLAWSGRPGSGGPLLRYAEMARWEESLLASPVHGGLWEPLVVLAGELKRPRRAKAPVISKSCLAIADWASESRALETALLFTEAAAFAWPENPRYAWIAGRLFRTHGRPQEAEYWLRRSARVAVWRDDLEAHELALNSLGNLFSQQGSFSQAQKYLARALSVAKRCRVPERQGAITHDLFAVAVLTGEEPRAERLAASAFQLYGPDHPNLPKLAHDVAQLWLRQGRFAVALPVLHALRSCFHAPQDQLRVLASIARGAGACDERRAYERAWIEAWSIVHQPTPAIEAVIPAALVDLGLGAASLSDWSHAAEAFSLALEAATSRGAHEDAANAEMGLEMVGRYERADVSRRSTAGATVQLAEALVRSLDRMEATAGHDHPAALTQSGS